MPFEKKFLTYLYIHTQPTLSLKKKIFHPDLWLSKSLLIFQGRKQSVGSAFLGWEYLVSERRRCGLPQYSLSWSHQRFHKLLHLRSSGKHAGAEPLIFYWQWSLEVGGPIYVLPFPSRERTRTDLPSTSWHRGPDRRLRNWSFFSMLVCIHENSLKNIKCELTFLFQQIAREGSVQEKELLNTGGKKKAPPNSSQVSSYSMWQKRSLNSKSQRYTNQIAMLNSPLKSQFSF